jgi:hypothetical protein
MPIGILASFRIKAAIVAAQGRARSTPNAWRWWRSISPAAAGHPSRLQAM